MCTCAGKVVQHSPRRVLAVRQDAAAPLRPRTLLGAALAIISIGGYTYLGLVEQGGAVSQTAPDSGTARGDAGRAGSEGDRGAADCNETNSDDSEGRLPPERVPLVKE